MTATTMTSAQALKKNADDFKRSFHTLHRAAIGVTQVRTKEPFRAIDALRDFAYTQKMEFKVWTILQGWQTGDRTNPDRDPAVDNVIDPLAALKAITAMGGPANAEGFPNPGLYVMMHPHKQLSQHLGMVQIVKEYAKTFAGSKQRLVLLTPFGYTLPEELQDDVVILDFEPPSFAELRETYDRLAEDMPPDRRMKFNAAAIEGIISTGAGMTKQEFENAVSRAIITHAGALPNVQPDAFKGVVAKVKTEVIKRSEVLELMEPVPMDRIGGLDNLKDWVGKRAHCFSQDARDFGVDAPKGIALIGPPGTGKSAASKAISSVLGIPLLKLDVGRLFAGIVGASEARVREALRMVDSMAPCVLFIDEVDKAFNTNNSGGDSGVGTRILGTLLTWMQETQSPVFMIVTANRTENLPSEFLRRGRLDEVFSVTVPNEAERLEITKIHLRTRKQDVDSIPDLEAAVVASAGYVAAELEAAVKDAILEAFVRKQPVTGALIAQQLSYMQPLSVAFADQFARMAEWAENNARPASVAEGEAVGAGTPRQRQRVRVPSTAAVVEPKVGGRGISLDS